jgi:hypothetical protein
MIVENITQRGYESFGAVMDSVAAVVIAMVKDCYDSHNFEKLSKNTRTRIKSGGGFEEHSIHKYEPSISKGNAKAAIDCLKAAGQ